MTGSQLARVPLHQFHLANGGKMVAFAGYEMPVQYAAGVLKEHLHTRKAAGLFDVSHMGQIILRPRTGAIADAARALETLVPIDIVSLSPGRQRYAFFTTESGGISDDLMVANFGTHLLLIVNAARKVADEAYLRQRLSDICHIEPLPDRALLALQGPQAGIVLAAAAPTVAAMRFMDAGLHTIGGATCFVTRSGYTGEDGFEISLPAEAAITVAEQLLENPEVELIGLGARDSLRLEAGLCLFGSDIDFDTTPVEAGLEWAIQSSRRSTGQRPAGFPGASIILGQLERGVEQRRIGLRPGSRPVRAGSLLFFDDSSNIPIGRVTSGGFGPSIKAPVAMGYIPTAAAKLGERLYAELGGQRHLVTVAEMPFVKHNYRR
jgi:aminomethyltransferase